MTIPVIRYAVTVTVPAATIQVPPVTALLPAIGLIDVTTPLAYPGPPDPHVTVAAPVPITWCPNVATTCCRDNFGSVGRWCYSNRHFDRA